MQYDKQYAGFYGVGASRFFNYA